jgi:hypothetical protein
LALIPAAATALDPLFAAATPDEDTRRTMLAFESCTVCVINAVGPTPDPDGAGVVELPGSE